MMTKMLVAVVMRVRREHYVTRVTWSDDNRLAVVWSNRAQNASIITICDHNADFTCYSVSKPNVACSYRLNAATGSLGSRH